MCHSRASNLLRATKNDFFGFIPVDHGIKHFYLLVCECVNIHNKLN